MCGRYASSRRPEDLAEEFEIDRARLPETVTQPLDPDFNVAPTKPVYAVVTRPPGQRDDDEDGAARDPERQLRVLRWGPVFTLVMLTVGSPGAHFAVRATDVRPA